MRALVDACDEEGVPGEVVAVIADRRCPGLDFAESKGIATALVETQGSSREVWSAWLRDVVAGHRPDLVVSAGFMRILAPVFVDAFAGKLINLHPSLLPAFPGPRAVRDALDAGVKITGTTVHFVDHEVDRGPIILQEPVRVEQFDSEESLHERIKEVEHRLLPHACRLLLEGRVRRENRRVVVEHD